MVESGIIAGGRFRLIKAIGKGGMSTVWWARHELIGRDVALKLSPSSGRPDHTVRFQREAQIIGKFQHRNIVSILDAGEFEDQGCYFLAMELLHGRPFADRFVRGKPLAATEVLPILIDVCRGLEVAHAAGVVHRDIKPENIFLADVPGEGTVPKILDFGISKMMDTTITADGQILGTPAYMSPEQASGARDVTTAADIWAIGVILYEALAGQQPFPSGDYRYLLLSILEKAPEPLPHWVSAPLRAIVERCLQKDPAARYPSAASLREDLERALERCPEASHIEARASREPLAPLSTIDNAALFMSTVVSPSPAAKPPPPAVRPRSRTASLFVLATGCLSACGVVLFRTPAPAAAPVPRLEASIGLLAQTHAASVRDAARDASPRRVAEVTPDSRAPIADRLPPTKPAARKAPSSAPRRAFVTRINNPGF